MKKKHTGRSVAIVSNGVKGYILLLIFISIVSSTKNVHCEKTVRLYYWGNELDLFAGETVRDFEHLYNGTEGRPKIKVVMGQSASLNKTDDPQRLLCAVAGGDPPDVVFFDRFAVAQWASRGAFRSLQEFYERDLREKPDDPLTLKEEYFFPPCWKESQYNGKLYAIPCDTDNRALYYNLDLLEKYAEQLKSIGCVDPNNPNKVGPPRTWEQLKKAAVIMTEKDTNGDIKQIGFIPNYGNSWLYIYGWLNGGTFMSEDGKTCTLNSPEIIEALAFMSEIYDAMGGAEKVMAFQSSMLVGDLDPFVAGKVAMKIDGDFAMIPIANARRSMRFGVVPAPAPEGKNRVGWTGGFSFVIPSSARHPEEAWLFIKYLVSKRAIQIRNDAEAEKVRGSGTIFIPRMSARRDLTEWIMEYYLYSDPTVENTFKNAMKTFIAMMPEAKYRPVTPVGQLLWNEHVRAMWEGIYKKYDTDYLKNAKRALDRSTTVVQRELDKINYPVEHPTLSWTPIVTIYIIIIITILLIITYIFFKKSKAKGYFRKEYYAGYFFASPWFLGFLIFGGGPLLFSLIMSFCNYDVLSPPKWVGFENYQFMISDPLFYKSLWNTIYMTISVPLGMIISLGIALLLQREWRGMATYRTLFYLPAIMPGVAASILWLWIFNPQEGMMNAILTKLGTTGPNWLQDPSWSKPALIIMTIWSAGGSMIIWLAGLKTIPVQLYEAAEIDGAGIFQKFFYITLPMLSPYILFNLIMGFIATFQIFTQAFIMTQGGPVDSTLFYAYYLFNNGFQYLRMGYASALAWILFGIIFLLTLLQLKVSQKWVYYEREQ